jgi:purine-cytosine permease-like protein
VLVSLVAAPYCWLYDQAVAMPALLDSAYTTRSRHLLTALALINIPIVIALICGIKIISAFYLWTAPAWLVLYLFARWSMADPTAEDGRDDLQRQMTTANN